MRGTFFFGSLYDFVIDCQTTCLKPESDIRPKALASISCSTKELILASDQWQLPSRFFFIAAVDGVRVDETAGEPVETDPPAFLFGGLSLGGMVGYRTRRFISGDVMVLAFGQLASLAGAIHLA